MKYIFFSIVLFLLTMSCSTGTNYYDVDLKVTWINGENELIENIEHLIIWKGVEDYLELNFPDSSQKNINSTSYRYIEIIKKRKP